MPRRTDLLLIAVGLLHLLVAGWYAWHRPIDGDEGYYGLAARLVSEGQTPYADFFYPQAPLIPYLYAPAAAMVGAPQLPQLRLLSVLLSACAVAAMALLLRREIPEAARPAAVVALLLLALSPELLLWNVTVKTYAWVNLMVAVSLLAFQRGERGAAGWFAAGGAALGLAVSARLLYAPVAVVPAAWLVLRGPARRWRAGALWLAGLAAGLLPTLLALVRAPQVFWFNNLGYHQLRFSELEDASLPVRVLAALKTLAVAILTDPGLLVLTLLAGLAVAWSRRGPDPRPLPATSSLALAMGATLALTCLLPDPTHRQYFTGGLPILLAAPATVALARWPAARARHALVAAAVAAPVLGWLGLAVLRHDLPSERWWQLDHYRTVSARIASLTGPRDTVFAFWSGYVGGSGRRPYPGLENHFGVGVSERLSARERARYHLVGRREIADAFRLERPRLVVIGAWMNEIDTALDDPQMADLLQHFTRHYQAIEDHDGVKLALRLRELERR